MTRFEALLHIATALVAVGRTPTGAVAAARELLDELERQEPEAHAAQVRRQIADAVARARGAR